MGVHVIKLPDVGEGVAEAELVEWMVKPGDNVMEDQILAAVMTDKATVEIPSPVIGKVTWLGAETGEIVAVGSPIVRLDVDGAGNAKDGEAAPVKAEPKKRKRKRRRGPSRNLRRKSKRRSQRRSPRRNRRRRRARRTRAPRKEGEKPLASPAVRKRAADAGVDLRRVPGTGPAGRITHEDLDGYFEHGAAAPVGRSRAADTSVKEMSGNRPAPKDR
ncbi:MAG: biotin/lipoyl-containing protein [Parvularculaceae bacterium]